jgi:hypothetical protein
MKHHSFFICVFISLFTYCNAQTCRKANDFIKTLDNAQRTKALYPFDTDERYRFHFVPQDDRKGVSLNELNANQLKAVMDLLQTCLSKETVNKLNDIRQLELVLKELEKRTPEDNYRDPGKYFVTIFWHTLRHHHLGWRFEGHHMSFHFSADKNQLVAGTPGFIGSNPAIVLMVHKRTSKYKGGSR